MIAFKIFFQLLCLYLLIINIVHGRPKYKKNKFQRANQLSNLGIKQRKNGEFKLFGRGSEADIRGCNLMLTGFAN